MVKSSTIWKIATWRSVTAIDSNVSREQIVTCNKGLIYLFYHLLFWMRYDHVHRAESSLSRELTLCWNDTLGNTSSVTASEVRIELVQSWLQEATRRASTQVSASALQQVFCVALVCIIWCCLSHIYYIIYYGESEAVQAMCISLSSFYSRGRYTLAMCYVPWSGACTGSTQGCFLCKL